MYAIIATGGKQYKVSEGDVIKVEKLGAEAGSNYVFDQVLAVCDDALTVGTPVVEGATVEASVLLRTAEIPSPRDWVPRELTASL